MYRFKYIFPWLIAIVSSLLFFSDSILSYFSQDDFYHLRQVMTMKFTDIPTMFIPAFSSEQTFYRPLSRELFNFVSFSLFGLNPLAFHIINATIILLVTLYLYLFLKKISNNRAVLIIGPLVYLFSSVHSVELYYLPSVQTLLATLFSLIALNSYLSNESGIKKYKPVIFFGLAVLSHESALVLAPIIILHKLLFNKPKFDFWPFVLIAGIRMSIISTSGLPNQAVYNPDFHIRSIANTATWMMLWSFNFSEILPDFMGFFWIQNKNVLSWYSGYFILFSITTTFFFLLLTIFILLSRKSLQSNKYFLWGICSYIISLFPFVFFPAHKFSYYLSFTAVWLSVCLGLIFGYVWGLGRKWQILSTVAVVLFISSSKLTVDLNAKTHWSAKRAMAAKYLIHDVRLSVPNPEAGAIFYFKNDIKYPNISSEWGTSAKQAFYILSGSDALKLVFNDSTVKVYFEGINDKGADLNSKAYHELNATFPF